MSYIEDLSDPADPPPWLSPVFYHGWMEMLQGDQPKTASTLGMQRQTSSGEGVPAGLFEHLVVLRL